MTPCLQRTPLAPSSETRSAAPGALDLVGAALDFVFIVGEMNALDHGAALCDHVERRPSSPLPVWETAEPKKRNVFDAQAAQCLAGVKNQKSADTADSDPWHDSLVGPAQGIRIWGRRT